MAGSTNLTQQILPISCCLGVVSVYSWCNYGFFDTIDTNSRIQLVLSTLIFDTCINDFFKCLLDDLWFVLLCAGLEHCKTAPISNAYDNVPIESHELALLRSKTEKKETPKHDLRLDRLPEHEKVMWSLKHVDMYVIYCLVYNCISVFLFCLGHDVSSF